jgi:hypothetical protein
VADEFLSLREAAGRVGRSSGTLRRYIKTGRLAAEKLQGKFGIEYRIRARDLEHLQVGRTQLQTSAPSPPPVQKEWIELMDRFIPVSVFNDLSQKHERLLIEFGMLRARKGELSGQSPAELKSVLQDPNLDRLKAQAEEDKDRLRLHLRETEQEVRDREADIILLREKVNRLEQQFLEVHENGPVAVPGLEIAGETFGQGAQPEPQRVRRAVGRLRQLLEICQKETEASRGS